MKAAATKHNTFVWPGLIFIFLGINVTICAITAYLATSDHSFRVVTDYDTKASQWDKEQARIRAGEALGWDVQLRANPLPGGSCELSASITDASKAPLANPNVSLEAFHDAFPNDIVRATFSSATLGEYAASIPIHHEGRWTVRVTVQHAGNTYEKSFLKDIYLPLATR